MYYKTDICHLKGVLWLIFIMVSSVPPVNMSRSGLKHQTPPILSFSNVLQSQGKIQFKCEFPKYIKNSDIFVKCPLDKGYCMRNCSMVCSNKKCNAINETMSCKMEYDSKSGVFYALYTIDGTIYYVLGEWYCYYRGLDSNHYNLNDLVEKPKSTTKASTPSTSLVTTVAVRKPSSIKPGKPGVLPPHKKSRDLNSMYITNSLLQSNQAALIILLLLSISVFGNLVLGCRFICSHCSYKKHRRENSGGGLLSRFFNGSNSCHDDEKFSTIATHSGNHPPQMMNSLYVTHPANQFRLQQQTSQLNCSEQNTIYDDTSLVVGFQGNPAAGNVPLPPPPLLSRIQNGSGHYVAPSTICPPTPLLPPQPNSTPSLTDNMHNNEVYLPMKPSQNRNQSTSSSALQQIPPLQINPVTSSNHDNTMNNSHSNTIQYTNFIPDPSAIAQHDPNQVYLSFYSPHPSQQPIGTPHFMYACNSTNHLPISPNMHNNGTINNPHHYNNQSSTNQNHSSLQSLNNLRNPSTNMSSPSSHQPITTTTNENGEPQKPITNQNGDVLNGHGSTDNEDHMKEDENEENVSETSKLMLEKGQRQLQSADSYLNSPVYNKP